MVNLQQLTGEEKILQARFQDAITAARMKNQIKFVGFLDLRGQQIVKAVAQANGFSAWQLFGGYDGAERCVAGFFPDYIDAQEDQSFLFPIKTVTAKFRQQDKLTHRDFLGSLMGLKIERELTGDILVGQGTAVFFTLETAFPLIMDELVKIGRVGVSLSEGALDLDLEQVRPVIKPLSGTVNSPRLDAVVAFLTRLSREKAQNLLRAELVKVDGQVRTDTSGSVEAGNVVSVRGYGKYIIHAFDGMTKKGRLRIAAGHYE